MWCAVVVCGCTEDDNANHALTAIGTSRASVRVWVLAPETMKTDTKRFLVILGCTAVAAVLVFEIPPVVMNTIDQRRLERIEAGMSREAAMRILHSQPVTLTNGTEEITVWQHRSWLRDLFSGSASGEGRTVMIETGRVTQVAWSSWVE